MLKTSTDADAGMRRSPRRRVVAIAVLVALAASASWAGYRMLDPVASYAQGDEICHSTAALGVAPGVLTTAWIEVKAGRSIQVQSLTLVDPVNYTLAGSGILHEGAWLGSWEYPVGENDPDLQTAWLSRTELPATLGDGPSDSIMMALEPVDLNHESSLHAVRLRYSNAWGLPYSIDVGPRFEAKPNC